MLEAEQTIYYLRKAKDGDKKAKEILLENNSLLIKSIIKRFRNKGVEYDDLYQLGCVGFLKAVKNFDEKFGVVFSTYAVPMITGEVKRFLRDDGSIKVSRLIKSQSIKINRYIAEYGAKTGETPTVDEISAALCIDREDVVLALDSAKAPVSIYDSQEGNGGDKGTELVDRIPAPDREEDMIDKILLKSLIEKLPPREKKLIVMRYYGDNTQSEIATALGVSQVQISRLENKIIETFKKQI